MNHISPANEVHEGAYRSRTGEGFRNEPLEQAESATAFVADPDFTLYQAAERLAQLSLLAEGAA